MTLEPTSRPAFRPSPSVLHAFNRLHTVADHRLREALDDAALLAAAGATHSQAMVLAQIAASGRISLDDLVALRRTGIDISDLADRIKP